MFKERGGEGEAYTSDAIVREENIEKYREYDRNKMKRLRNENVNFKLSDNLRRRLNSALSGKIKKTMHTMELLGCSIDELKIHLESKFKTGMTWETQDGIHTRSSSRLEGSP